MDILDKIPIIDKKTSEIFKIIYKNYGKGKIFTKNDLVLLLNKYSYLKDTNIKYDILNDNIDKIYTFDIDRKKRGRPSKNKNDLNKIILSNKNSDNIFWNKTYIFIDKDIVKYWRYYMSDMYEVILNHGIVIMIFLIKDFCRKNFNDKENMLNFIKNNIMIN